MWQHFTGNRICRLCHHPQGTCKGNEECRKVICYIELFLVSIKKSNNTTTTKPLVSSKLG
uniref:Uncharacterized protein n=1 Tax=Arundo donax TaxID=35708 RepID=A0A0A9G7M0_ARUDO